MFPAPSNTPFPTYHMARHPAPLTATFTLFNANRGKIVRRITG